MLFQIITIATPGSYFKQTVLAAAATPGVRAIQIEKPFGGPVADADDMVNACEAAGIVFAGGALSRAYPQVQETATRLQAGEFGKVVGASIHAWSAEMLGAGCQHTSVLRLLTGCEVVEIVAWCEQLEGMRDNQGRLVDAVDGAEQETGCREPVEGDTCQFSAQFTMSNGLVVPVFGTPNLCTVNLDGPLPNAGVRVWTDTGVLVWSVGPECGPPQIYRGVDSAGKRVRIDEAFATPPFSSLPWPHLTHAIRSLIDHLNSSKETVLAISGQDIRQALEVSTATYQSAMRGGVPMVLPLTDRVCSPVYPRGYRWGGGDSVGSAQSATEVLEKGGRTWEGLSTGYS
jgi:predicted dehydrogenase